MMPLVYFINQEVRKIFQIRNFIVCWKCQLEQMSLTLKLESFIKIWEDFGSCMPPYLGSDCARSLSSSAQVAITNYHRLGSLNNRNIYFSKAWKLKVKDQDAHIISVGEGSLPGLQTVTFSSWPYVAASKERKQDLWMSLIPSRRLLSQNLITSHLLVHNGLHDRYLVSFLIWLSIS